MKKIAATLALMLSASAFASDDVTYSVKGYCELDHDKNSITYTAYAKAYAKKLGFTPSRAACELIENEKFANVKLFKNDWDFHQNRPYRGSAIRLSETQVDLLRKAKLTEAEFSNILATIDQ